MTLGKVLFFHILNWFHFKKILLTEQACNVITGTHLDVKVAPQVSVTVLHASWRGSVMCVLISCPFPSHVP